MSRYIDFYLIGELVDSHGNVHYEDLKSLPTADVVERKRGEWIQHVNEPSLWSCSICETVIYSEHEEDRLKFHKWCGCCGADMRERREDDKVNTTDV